jgi:glutathione reductase (NADPH)
MQNFDVLVIGTGTAGDTAATLLTNAGLSVAIADEGEYGGTCALRGCQPKKYLVVPAHAAMEGAGLTARGFAEAPRLDWEAMQRSRREFVDAVPEGAQAGLRERGIATFHGTCSFVDATTVDVGGERIAARRILVATGGRPRPLSLPGGDLAGSSDDFLELPRMPRSITFIGGGYISMEFATVAAAAGADVTVLQRGDRVMDRFDADLVAELRKGCATRSIRVVTNAETEKITTGRKGTRIVHLAPGAVSPEGTKAAGPTTVESEVVIAALGRVPNIEVLNLEAAGVNAGGRGIEVDAGMRTSNPAVYAAGDCVVGIQLSPISDAEARTAARNIVADLSGGDERTELDISTLPTVVFTYPQLAQFGVSEEEARDRGGVRVNVGSGAGWPNYRRLNESQVAYKVMIDEATDRIVGAHILAPQAGELVNLLAIAARQGTTATAFREFPWAYPTYTADLKYMLG